jgi:hypothetical protein
MPRTVARRGAPGTVVEFRLGPPACYGTGEPVPLSKTNAGTLRYAQNDKQEEAMAKPQVLRLRCPPMRATSLRMTVLGWPLLRMTVRLDWLRSQGTPRRGAPGTVVEFRLGPPASSGNCGYTVVAGKAQWKSR